MPKKDWTFVTSHMSVLSYIFQNDQVRGIDIALALNLTERSIRRIISDLEAEGYIKKKKVGLYNRYAVVKNRPMRRTGTGVTVNEVLSLFASGKEKIKRT